jgi:hypothetical protein
MLAAILLLIPVPQIANTVKAVTPTVEISNNTPAASEALPEAPEAKVASDAEIAEMGSLTAIEPGVEPLSKAVKPMIERPQPSKTERRMWYALSFVGSGAAAFDAWSTRRAISGNYAVEANPLLRPFAHSGAMYAATQVSPLMMDFLGKKMMVSNNKMVRKMWWLPQVAGSGVSIAAGVHNVGMVP